MAQYVIVNPYVLISASDISDHIKSATLEVTVAEQDSTDAASSGWTEHLGGLKSGTLSLEVYDDKAAASIDAIMWSTLGLGTVQTFEVRAVNTTVSTTNPKYTGSVLINSTTPLSGAVGDVAMISLKLPTSGAVTRATS